MYEVKSNGPGTKPCETLYESANLSVSDFYGFQDAYLQIRTMLMEHGQQCRK